jgi:serine/threonine-protein kinase
VPPLIGLREEAAVDQIEKLGFKASVKQGSSTEFDAGFVMEQSPTEGTKLPKGETVTIVVSQGAPKTEVPSVVGLTYDAAVDQLAQAKLKAKRKEVFSDKPAGQVTKQSPKPGESVVEGSTVTLTVSKGTETATVPDVLQQSKASATAELQAAGFNVTSGTASSNDTPEGLVMAQNPNPGVEANKGSTVNITISTGPESVTVPNVVGQDQDTAEQTLEEAGFVVTTVEEPTIDPTQDGLVVDQDPRGGVRASPGSEVQITVATLATPRRRGG